jgi:hypothetical protein
MNRISCKRIVLPLIFILSFNFSYGQLKHSDKTLKEKIFFGGSLGLTIGTVTQIDIVPVAGIWIFPQWSMGVSGRYSYYSYKAMTIGLPNEPYRTHIWGGSVFTQILPIADFSEVTPIKLHGGILFHAEYERLFVDRGLVNPFDTNATGKTWIELYLLGVGYRQKLGEKAALNIMLLWEVSNNRYSPYPQNPMLRINFTI